MGDATTTLLTERLLLTTPGPEFASRLAAYQRDNRAHLAPWNPPLPDGFDTEEHWRARLAEYESEAAQERSLRFVVLQRAEPDGPVVGTVNFTQFCRGPFRNCFLGFGLGARFEGRGLVTEAARAGIAHVFGALGMHRITATHVPWNRRSAATLRRLGFVVEGYARDYLFIDGAWRDHVLLALTNPQAPSPTA